MAAGGAGGAGSARAPMGAGGSTAGEGRLLVQAVRLGPQLVGVQRLRWGCGVLALPVALDSL